MNKYNTIRLNQMHKALIRLRLTSIIQWLTQIIQSILLIYLVHQMASYTIETSLEEAAYFLANTTMIFVAIHLARCLIRQFLKMNSNTNFRNFRFFDRVEREICAKLADSHVYMIRLDTPVSQESYDTQAIAFYSIFLIPVLLSAIFSGQMGEQGKIFKLALVNIIFYFFRKHLNSFRELYKKIHMPKFGIEI